MKLNCFECKLFNSIISVIGLGYCGNHGKFVTVADACLDGEEVDEYIVSLEPFEYV